MPLRKYVPVEDLARSYFHDDFAGSTYDTRAWTAYLSTGSTLTHVTGSDIGGQLRVRATGAAARYTGIQGAGLGFSVAKKFSIVWRAKLLSLTAARMSLGLRGTADTERCNWQYDSPRGIYFYTQSVTGGVATQIDSDVVADTNFHEFRIVGSSATGTPKLNFFIDGVSKIVIDTNVPTTDLGMWLRSYTEAASSADVYVDWVEAFGDRVT